MKNENVGAVNFVLKPSCKSGEKRKWALIGIENIYYQKLEFF